MEIILNHPNTSIQCMVGLIKIYVFFNWKISFIEPKDTEIEALLSMPKQEKENNLFLKEKEEKKRNNLLTKKRTRERKKNIIKKREK